MIHYQSSIFNQIKMDCKTISFNILYISLIDPDENL